MSHASMTESDAIKKDFLEINRTYVKENSLKRRFTSHLGRVRQLRSLRRTESMYQTRLNVNMNRSAMAYNQKINLGVKQSSLLRRNYPVSLERLRQSAKVHSRGNYATTSSALIMHKPFQEGLNDRRSLKVFKKNTLRVDPDINN